MVMENHNLVVHLTLDALEIVLVLYQVVQMKLLKIIILMLIQMMDLVLGMVVVLILNRYLVMMVVHAYQHLMFVMDLLNMVTHRGDLIVLMVLMRVQIVVNLELMQLKFV